MIGVQVRLNSLEIRLAKAWAKDIQKWDTGLGMTDQKQDAKRTSEEIALLGCLGEIAFGKLFRLYPNLEVRTVSQKNDKGDYRYGDVLIDVKTAERPDARLNCRITKGSHVHLYALMTGPLSPGDAFTFRGAVQRTILHQPHNIQDIGYGPFYTMGQAQLYDLYPLIQDIQRKG